MLQSTDISFFKKYRPVFFFVEFPQLQLMGYFLTLRLKLGILGRSVTKVKCIKTGSLNEEQVVMGCLTS